MKPFALRQVMMVWFGAALLSAAALRAQSPVRLLNGGSYLSEADADLLALKAAVVDDNGLNLALLGRLVWTWFQDDELYAARG